MPFRYSLSSVGRKEDFFIHTVMVWFINCNSVLSQSFLELVYLSTVSGQIESIINVDVLPTL